MVKNLVFESNSSFNVNLIGYCSKKQNHKQLRDMSLQAVEFVEILLKKYIKNIAKVKDIPCINLHFKKGDALYKDPKLKKLRTAGVYTYDLAEGSEKSNIDIFLLEFDPKSADYLAKVILHEIGHFIYAFRFSSKNQKAWKTKYLKSFRYVDLEYLECIWPQELKTIENVLHFWRKNPNAHLLHMQLCYLSDHSRHNVLTRNDLKKMRRTGIGKIRWPILFLTDYAFSTSEEMWCEALSTFLMNKLPQYSSAYSMDDSFNQLVQNQLKLN